MNPIIATTETSSRTFYELAPLLPITEWWQFLLAMLIVVLAVAFIVTAYVFDSIELPLPLTITLTFLRLAAIVGLIVYFVNLEKRSEQRIVRNSRVAVLVDTSLSMGLRDTGNSADSSEKVSRLDQVVDWLANSDFIQRLRDKHDVVAYQFGEESRAIEVAAFSKVPSTEELVDHEAVVRQSQLHELQSARLVLWVAVGLLAVSVLFSLFAGLMRLIRGRGGFATWVFAASVFLLVGALGTMAVSDLICVPANLLETLGVAEFQPKVEPFEQVLEENASGNSDPNADSIDWQKTLVANGTLTRMGDALRYVVNKEREGPVAGIVLITDGRNNAGADYRVSMAAARDAGIPVYTIGAGSNQSPRNVRVVDVKAPQRVFPKDKFKLTGLIQSFGFAGEQLQVQLFSVDEKETEAPTLEAEGTLTSPPDGKPEPITFELQNDEQGVRVFRLRVSAPAGDLDALDNEASIRIEFIDRKQKVLLIAGGPMREYQFLRNQLFRDPQTISHVFLQTAVEGADQEGAKTIFSFPETREEWFEYDCIIGFDPDWRDLKLDQAKWLEQWVSEKAGGLILIAGPVNTPEWTKRPRGDDVIDIVRQLYPVSFYNQATSVVKLGRFGGEKPYPLEFTREGRASEFLWLADTAAASQDVWASSKGVFGYYAVSEAKAGAEIYTRFSDPDTSIGGDLPIYMCGQFYGAGRVFFQASGEMWRMRTIDPEYFERYYTQLIRWVSQGRLTRDSTRGVLLVDRDKVWLGDQVTVQAILRDAQDQPLDVPSVTAVVLQPDGQTRTLELNRVNDATNRGTYTGQVTTNREGRYRISLAVPDSPDNEVLTVQLTANIPDLEIEQPERNDMVLQEIADQTKGVYFENVREATNSDSQSVTLASMIEPRDQETFLPGTTDVEFTRRMMMWLLGIVTAVLCFEWIIRRLNRLA